MSKERAVAFDIEQLNLVDYYAKEICVYENDPSIGGLSFTKIRAALIARIFINEIENPYENIKVHSGVESPKILMIDDSAFFAYAHGMIFNSLGLDVTHIWSQQSAVGLNFSSYDYICISESRPSIHAGLLKHLIDSNSKRRNQVIFALTENRNQMKLSKMKSMGIHEVFTKPMRKRGIEELLLRYMVMS